MNERTARNISSLRTRHSTNSDVETGVQSIPQSSDLTNRDVHNISRLCSNCCNKFTKFFSFDGNNNARALALIKIPEASLWVASSVYLSTAIIERAYADAGCMSEIPEGETEIPECHNRVFGIKPSSILSLFVMVLGITCAILMPLVGALLDASNRRRLVGGLTALGVTILTFAQSFISKDNWFIVFILQLVSFVLLTVNSCVALAYLPELTQDKHTLARYNTVIMIFNSVAVVLFLIVMTIITTILHTDDSIQSARIALLATFSLQLCAYGISWTKLFGARQAAHSSAAAIDVGQAETKAKSNHNIIHESMQSLKRTLVQAFKQRSEVRWFLLFRATSQPVIIALTAATLSYANDQIQVSSRDVGIMSLIVLAFAVPGNKLSLTFMERFNPLTSLKICTLLWATLGPLLALIVSKPGHEMRLFLLAMFWGVLFGWKDPADKTILCSLVPHGIEAEMSGLYIFAGQILMWVSEKCAVPYYSN